MVVDEVDAAREGRPAIGDGIDGEAGGDDREAPRCPDREAGGVRAGDGGRLVDSEGEALGPDGGDPVARGDREVVDAAAARGGSADERCSSVVVVGERDSAGSAAEPSEIVSTGKPVVVTVKLPLVPSAKVVVAALVMAGAWSTVRIKL